MKETVFCRKHHVVYNQAMFTLYHVLAFKPARKPGRASLLFTK